MEVTSAPERSRPSTNHAAEGTPSLWAWLREKVDPALYQPQAASGTVVSHLAGREGDYYVLKNPVDTTYCRLSARDHFLWERMDGTRTVKDLVVAYYLEYGSFAFARVAGLVQGLKANSFLVERPVNIYQQIRSRLEARRPGHRWAQVFRAFLQTQFGFRGLDRFVASLYRWGGRLLFSWPVQILWLIVSTVGLYAFARALSAGQYGLVTIAGSLRLGIIGLVVANLCAIFLHEMAHALAVKHYGCEVNRGGFMIYVGLPAFYVDTTDIWLQGKRARLAVTWAGPYSGLILGGLASISLLLWPEQALNPLLFQFAVLTYLSVFLNLNPLLELDGYYLLMDWLEIPMLRRRSLEFIREGLWLKVRSLKATMLSNFWTSFSREERIFAVFGLLSAVWTAFALFMSALFWQRRLSGALHDLWTQGGSLGRTALAAGLVVLGSIIILSFGLAVLGLARRLWGWASRKGMFANTWYVAGMLLVLSVALAAIPALLGYSAVAPLLSLLALAASAVLAWRMARIRAGSRLSPFFWLLGFFALLLLLGQAASLAGSLAALPLHFLDPVAHAVEILAFLVLFLAGLLLFANTDLRELLPVEKGLLLLGMLLGYGLVFWLAGARQTANISLPETLLLVSRSLIPLLVLTLLVPTLFSFWRTAFGPAWVMLGLVLGGLSVMGLLSLPLLLSSLLLAASLLLHHLAYTSLVYHTEPRQATLDLNDRRRLERAFCWTTSAILDQFYQLAGARAGRVLTERFNNHAVAADWRISITKARVEDFLPADMSLIERGERYAAALSQLLDLVIREMGHTSTVRALQKAYDGLPWEEREIGAQYLFRDVEQAGALGPAFQATRQDYQGLLRRMPLFATMNDQDLELLLSRLKQERHVAGKAIVRQGEVGDRFYIVRRGHVEVTQRDERGVTEIVNQLDRGDYFGEVALLRDAPRNATCRATVPTETLSLSRQDFDTLVKRHFALRDKVDRSLARAELLRRIPLFAELTGLQIQHVAAQLQEEKLEAGVIFVRQGELGETFYVIESGRVEVFASGDGAERVVVERGPGEYVGEIALLLEVPRTASVRTLGPTHLLVLQKADFEPMVREHLFISRGLEQESSRRMIDLRRAVPQA